MNAPATFMVSMGQCLSTMSLYPSGHPAREKVIDASFTRLLDVLADIQFAEFSIIGSGVVFLGRVLDELRAWDWAPRLAAAGIERLEIDADVTREAWSQALDEMWQQLNGHPPASTDARHLTAVAIRFGPLRVMGGEGEAGAVALDAADAEQTAEPAPDPTGTFGLTLSDEVAAVTWLHEEVLTSNRLPMAEVEAIVGSLAMAMRSEQKMLLPLLMLKDFDQYTTTHACNVSVLAMGLAEQVGCSRAEIRAFGVAGLLHDIGKVHVPKEILNKPGRLTDDEKAVMATHPTEGARILLERHKGLQMASVVAYEHHVCIDGHGYPRFHFERGCHYASRLVHVCDIYDALSTNRPYRKPWTPEQSLQYIEERAGTEVDPDVSRAFGTLVRSSLLGHIPMPERGD
ncbi:MAG: HD domain-containing protein [Gemmatimonadetes bacterium]|nr:HD domain-containing protein [Gemmatimonadota bacterium]